jgi:hypothetical protein
VVGLTSQCHYQAPWLQISKTLYKRLVAEKLQMKRDENLIAKIWAGWVGMTVTGAKNVQGRLHHPQSGHSHSGLRPGMRVQDLYTTE